MSPEDIQEGPETAPRSFEEQFAARQSIEVAGGMAEVIDITPEHIKDEVPVMLSPGCGLTATREYKPIIEELAKNERRVIALDHPRAGGDLDGTVAELKAKA